MCSVIIIDVKKKVLNNPSAASSLRYLKRALMSEGATRVLLYKAALSLQEQPARMVPYSSVSWLMETFTTNPVRLRRNKRGSVVHRANEAMSCCIAHQWEREFLGFFLSQ